MQIWMRIQILIFSIGADPDADPTINPDADPDPDTSFRKKTNPQKVLKIG
jgi:hypothetical protein